VAKALASGANLNDFIKAVKPELQRKGFWGDVEITDPTTGEIRIGRFNDQRLALIYDTNLRQSYAAGRWAAIERNKRQFPFVLYQTMRDERVRASHRPWHGVCLPVDHDFWRTHYPPNGWRCRCRAFSISQRDLDRRLARGESIKTTAPEVQWVSHLDRATGRTEQVPRGIDPGFAYNPGKAHMRTAGELQARALQKVASPPLAAAAVQAGLRSAGFARWYAAPPAGAVLPVAVLAPEQAALVQSRATVVMLSDETATKQRTRHPDLQAADYAWVQTAVDEGTPLRDGARTVVYLLERDGWVAVVKSTRTGAGLWLTSFRRLSSDAARRDREVRRLRGRAQGGQ
jgi:SPP1 gp7 family putative phage head morphogenesis protein